MERGFVSRSINTTVLIFKLLWVADTCSVICVHLCYLWLKLFNNSSGVATAVPILPTTMPAA